MKNNSKIFFLIVLMPAIILIACSEKKYSTPESVIYANAKYMTEEKLSGVMNTIHSASPAINATEHLVKELFRMYDLEYKIESLVIIEEMEDEAKVRFIQSTTKLNGPEFRNNRLTGIHELKKENGSWKIFNTISEKIDYL